MIQSVEKDDVQIGTEKQALGWHRLDCLEQQRAAHRGTKHGVSRMSCAKYPFCHEKQNES